MERFEDLIYNDKVDKVSEPQAEIFKLELENFNRARILKEGLDLPFYQELVKILEEMATQCRESENAYQGLDEEKIKKLRLERIKANHALSVVRGIVEEAANVPMPQYAAQ